MARNRIVASGVRRTAEEVKRYRLWMRLLPIAIAIAILILIVGYVISVLYMKFGAFTVAVNKYDNLEGSLTLSASQDFSVRTSRLNAEIDEIVTNIDGKTLPDWLDNVDGEHNGENYVAYTFYCRNESQFTVDYTYELYIANMTQEIERAARIRLYVDGEMTDYAFPRTDGGEGPEPGTTAFLSATTVCKKTIENFHPMDVTKYTVVIWLEGNDPECVDSVIGGVFKVDMAMEVVGSDKDASSKKSSSSKSASSKAASSAAVSSDAAVSSKESESSEAAA